MHTQIFEVGGWALKKIFQGLIQTDVRVKHEQKNCKVFNKRVNYIICSISML